MKALETLAAIAFVLTSVFAQSVNIYAAPLTPGNVLVSDLDSGRVIEYTPSGAQVQLVNLGFADIRDVTVGTSGEVHIFNAPRLTTVTPADGAVVHRAFPGWSSTFSRTNAGGIGTMGDFIFVTDTAPRSTIDPDNTSGLLRIDLRSGDVRRTAEGRDYIDLSIAGDGLLYGLREDGWFVDVFDPHSLGEIRSISLESNLRVAGIRSITVDANGTIYAAPWGRTEVYAVNQSGIRVDSLLTPGIAFYTDIDLDNSGRLLLGNWDGDVILTDVNLDSYSRFVTNDNPFVPTKMIHVAFTSLLVVVPEPASVGLLFSAGLLFAGRSRRPATATFSKGVAAHASPQLPQSVEVVVR
jgi:hypothetical protein